MESFSNDTEADMNENYSYHYYSYDENPSWLPGIEWTTELKIQLPIFAICFLLGFIGNLLVIFAVVKSKRLHNPTCLFLANLAVADLFITVYFIPLRLFVNRTGWSLGDALCRVNYFVTMVPPVVSVSFIITISVERYYVVLHPLKAKFFVTMRRAKIATACIWTVSCILSIPALFIVKVYGPRDGYIRDVCRSTWSPKSTNAILFSVYFFLLIFFIPLIILAYFYISIACHLNRTRKGAINDPPNCKPGDRSGFSSGSLSPRQTQAVTIEDETAEMDPLRTAPCRMEDLKDSPAPRRHGGSSDGDNIQRVITMVVIVTVLFILCWGPINMYFVIERFFPLTYDVASIFETVLNLLAALNSCLNPVIYAFFSRHFRQAFKQVIRKCCCCALLKKCSSMEL